MSASITLASKCHFPTVQFIRNVIQHSDSAVCVCVCLVLLLVCKKIFVFLYTYIHERVSCLYRVVCEMAAAPKASAPGPVKLCVGECRPELRAQSSQLYSFVVILTL